MSWRGGDNLLAGAMVSEDMMEDGVGVQQVFSQDGVDAGEGPAQVFGHQIGWDISG